MATIARWLASAVNNPAATIDKLESARKCA
ncbi:hypothetical protein SMKC082_02210 [Serratia marcescens]|uniref:Uncharacterized protein n=1 Tax=Serratia marcescens TaxID=615 RepID=A0A1C3H987_SERMA|nr:Uncharacterised protein [Serratia marcescens]SAY41610.1 Uncharacterised protein [Serratia marcescens]BEM36058.1 hypothetical protein SME06J_47500 [Serratia marcescens]BEM85322.1 hypothetical protein SME41J_46460 [Serratia marcescens]BEN76811.1 hypothetical protein SMKC082_02210 [Serratia marcescens]